MQAATMQSHWSPGTGLLDIERRCRLAAGMVEAMSEGESGQSETEW
jgi:hypothetical protein